MAYLEPHFDHDVFVSYSRGDPTGVGDSPLKRWTESLIDKLREDIQSVDIEFDQLHFWMDAQLDPTAPLTQELRDKVRTSGILMIFMSPRYLTSRWCKDELNWFGEQIRERSGEPGRVFVIRAIATEEGGWPGFLRDERGNSLIGFLFHDPISKRPYGWRDTSDRNEEFSKQLWTLKTALTARLRELRARYESRPRIQPAAFFAPPVPLPAQPAGAAERRRIYLHARGDQAPARSEVERLLSQINIVPLSARIDVGNALADWTREAKARFEAAKRCDALALVRTDENEGFIGDLLDIGVDERDRIQSERGKALPCAVLDQSGAPLPIDVSALGIRRFDLRHQDWQREFGSWLEDARRPGTGGA
jgi:hypothetical protein